MNQKFEEKGLTCRIDHRKIEAIEVDISTMSNDIEFTALKEELEILKYINDSIDYCINPNGETGGGSGDSGGSGQPVKPDKDVEAENQKKQAEEQAQAETQRQRAERLVRQTRQVPQKACDESEYCPSETEAWDHRAGKL